MGYSVYFVNNRWAGYGVPSTCDHPGCGAEIDRGLAYLCGEDIGSEKGCGLYFCSNHLWYSESGYGPQLCHRCGSSRPPFEPTPDTTEWVTHMATDPSWEQWRKENAK